MDDVSDIITVFFWHCDWEKSQRFPDPEFSSNLLWRSMFWRRDYCCCRIPYLENRVSTAEWLTNQQSRQKLIDWSLLELEIIHKMFNFQIFYRFTTMM